MSRFDITQHLLPIYLAVVFLIQIPLQILSVLAVIVPLILISFGLYRKKRYIGITGMALFILISLPQLVILFIDDIWGVFISVFFIGFPSILLLGQILQVENTMMVWFPLEKKKAILIAGILLIFICIVFYLVTVALQGDYLFSTSTTSGQVFLLAAISIILCVPLLLK